MQQALQITFRNMQPSEAMETAIREKVNKLEQFYNQLISCRIVIEAHHRHHHQGNLYHVRIDIRVPGKELVVSREPQQDHSHEDAYVAIRDAFDAMRRQLEDCARQQRYDVKTHEPPPHGVISELFPEEGYGYIHSADGRQIYFHQNSVLGEGFDNLELGDEVRFDEEQGDAGAQASTVHMVGKHHIVE